jgi:hypothetical protein|tara:strand:+ start:301 stop:1089 length:789 start_codon:yes stop_codon:yes gene_type:complete
MFFKKSISLVFWFIITTSCATANKVPAVSEPSVEEVVDPLKDALGLDLYFHIPEKCPLMGATCLIKSSNGQYTGSGVFIEKDAILTAAHVAEVCAGGVVMKDFNGEEISIIDTWVPVDSESNRIWGGLSRTGDIAILQLECEVDGVEPLDMLFEISELYDPSQYDNVFIAGCSLGFKKQSKEGTFLYYGVFENTPDSLKIWSSKAMVWYGDSGGPVAIKIGEEYFIIGVTSGFDLIQGCVVDTSACNVKYYKDDIEEYLNSF